MPLPSAILNPGLSDDTNFALELDTKMRYENLFNNAQDPIAFPLPEIRVPQTQIAQSGDVPPISIGEGLFSSDPKVANLANAHLQKQLNNNPVSKYGIGAPESFAYAPEMDKYINQDAGYNPYVSMAENEQFYYKRYKDQGMFDKGFSNLGVGLARFGSSVALKLMNTAGMVGSMLKEGIWEAINLGDPHNNAITNIADNSLSRWAEDMERDTKNSQLLSVFKPSDWNDMGFFEKATHGAFWTDEFADGAAFMGEMIASTYLLGGLGKLAGLSKLGAIPLSSGKLLGKAVRTLTGAQDIAGVGRWAFMTASESAMEASGKFHAVKDGLLADRNLGKNNLTNEDIEIEAGKAASSSFKDNMVILGLSNMFANRFIFEPILGRLRKPSGGIGKYTNMSASTSNLDDLMKLSRKEYHYSTKLGRKLNWKDPNGRLQFYGGRAVGGTVTEGYWEENAQLAAERLAANDNYRDQGMFDQFTDLLAKSGSQALSALPFKEYTGAFRDVEAETSIGLGALISGIATTTIAKATNERGRKEKYIKEVIDKYELGRRDFLSFQDVHVREKPDKDGRLGKLILDEDGNMQVDEAKALTLLAGIKDITDKLDTMSQVQDANYKKYLQNDALASFVMAAKIAGVYNSAMNAMSQASQASPEDIMNLGFDPNTTVDIGDVLSSMESVGLNYDKYISPKSMPQLKEDQTPTDEMFRKHALFDAANRLETLKKINQSYRQSIADEEYLTFNETYKPSDPSLQEYNIAVYRLLQLQHTKDMVSQVSDYHNDYFEKNEALLLEQIERLEAVIKRDYTPNDAGVYTTPDRFVIDLNRDRQIDDPVKKRIDAIKSSYEAVQTRSDTVTSTEKKNITKLASLLNLQAQYQDMFDKFSGANGIEEYKKRKEFYEAVNRKDKEEADKKAKEPPVAEGKPDGTIEIKKENEVVAVVTSTDEADKIVDSLTQQEQEEKDKADQEAAATKEAADLAAQQQTEEDALNQRLLNGTATYQEYKDAVTAILKEYENIDFTDELIPNLPAFLEATQEAQEQLTDEATFIITKFIELHNEKLKNDAASEADPATEPSETEESGSIEEIPTQDVPPIIPTDPPIEEPPTGDSLPSSLIDEVRHAYELHEQALLNDTSFEDEYKKQGLIGANNKINEAVAESKNKGQITFTTSNPSELQKGSIAEGVDKMGVARHNFLSKISQNPELREKFRLSLYVSKNSNLYSIVTDPQGIIVKFNTDGNTDKDGMPLSFFLDTDTYKAGNLEKRRSDLFKLGKIFSDIEKKTGRPVQGMGPLTATPIILHPSFLDNGEPRTDVIESIIEKIKSRTGPVLAQIDDVLQGMLYRDGVDNSFQIPLSTPSQTASELIDKGHVQDKVGDVILDDKVVTGTYQRANRVNFRLYRDIGNPAAGTELVEFITPTIESARRADGKSLFDTTVMVGDKEYNIFQAAIEGFLPSDKANFTFLRTILRPDQFLVLDTGNTLLLVNLKNFKKFLKSDNINEEALRALTTIDDIKQSSMNIFRPWYMEQGVIEMFDGILPSDSYTNFVNNNVKTSAKTINRGNSEGYSRINKRIILTLEDNFEDMSKRNNQEQQQNAGDEVSSVTPSEPMKEGDILERLKNAENRTLEELDDDAINTDC